MAKKTEEIVSLMRFTTLDELVKMIRLGGIPLYDTERWEDRCDAAFVERGVREMNNSKTTGNYGVMCFMGQTKKEKEEEEKIGKDGEKNDGDTQYSYSPRETIHHWKGYAGGKDGVGIKICFKPEVLLHAFLQKKYSDTKELKKSLEESDNILKGNGKIFGAMKYGKISTIQKRLTEGKAENFFFTKRIAFRDEREYRLVQYGKQVAPSCKDDQKWIRAMGVRGFIPVDNWSELIDRIVFSPFSDKRYVEKLRKGEISKESLRLDSQEYKILKDLLSAEVNYRSTILNKKSLLELAASDQGKTQSTKGGDKS